MMASVHLWWDGRSPRERALLAVLGVLMFAMIVWGGLVVPVERGRTAAQARLALATPMRAGSPARSVACARWPPIRPRN